MADQKTKLTKERMGEIALKFVRWQAQNKVIRLNPGFRREILSKAKELDIDNAEAMAFAEQIVREVVELTFTEERLEKEAFEAKFGHLAIREVGREDEGSHYALDDRHMASEGARLQM